MEVYSIRSQFAAMCTMSKDRDDLEKAALDAEEQKKSAKLGKKTPNAQKDKEDERGASRQVDGIGLSFFKSDCSFLLGCLPSIIERILTAHGLDIESANATINWQTYLELYCIFEAGKMDK